MGETEDWVGSKIKTSKFIVYTVEYTVWNMNVKCLTSSQQKIISSIRNSILFPVKLKILTCLGMEIRNQYKRNETKLSKQSLHPK